MQSRSPRLDQLRTRLEAVFGQKRGRKAELAGFLGVRPHMITEWMREKQPGGEYTLAMAEWVEQKEREDGDG